VDKIFMRVLITGANGHLGSALVQGLQAKGYNVTGADIDTMDITDPEAVRQTFVAAQPELVLHCAALTAVDYCAEHPDKALEVNGFGTQAIALACQRHSAAMLYVSTNEVFNGKRARPCLEYDQPDPINPYGYSKWMGEQIVRDLVPRHYIVRTSWLFSHGGSNFVHTVLHLAAGNQPLRVVTNEVGCPTYNRDLAKAICRLVATGSYGIYHLTNAGHVSRYAFARRVLDLGGRADTPIEPIALAEYPRASRPPEYAILRNMAAARLGITLRPWQEALAAFMESEGLLRGGILDD
jgi:dTDP-4-dehydrorhamnose reductase